MDRFGNPLPTSPVALDDSSVSRGKGCQIGLLRVDLTNTPLFSIFRHSESEIVLARTLPVTVYSPPLDTTYRCGKRHLALLREEDRTIRRVDSAPVQDLTSGPSTRSLFDP